MSYQRFKQSIEQEYKRLAMDVDEPGNLNSYTRHPLEVELLGRIRVRLVDDPQVDL